MYPVEVEENGFRCEYWISPTFQTCLKLKESKHKTNVFLIDGRYYERGKKPLRYMSAAVKTSRVRSTVRNVLFGKWRGVRRTKVVSISMRRFASVGLARTAHLIEQ